MWLPSFVESFCKLMAADGQWVALIKDPLATRASNEMAKVTLWKEENTGQDIELVGCGGSMVKGIVMELPFLALILHDNNRCTRWPRRSR